MKKIIATVLTALLLLSVVACENVSDESYLPLRQKKQSKPPRLALMNLHCRF